MIGRGDLDALKSVISDKKGDSGIKTKTSQMGLGDQDS